MLKALMSFGVGVYVGMFVAQNYQVPRVDNPEELWKKIQEFLDEHKKPGNDK